MLSYSVEDIEAQLSEDDIGLFHLAQVRAAATTYVWPPPTLYPAWGQKTAYYGYLDIVASKGTHTCRPQTELATETALDKLTPGCAKVIKRDYSNGGKHCLLLPKLTTYPKLKMAIQQVKESSVPWVIQDYIPELIEVGEWRFYCIDHKVQYGIHSCPILDKNGTFLKMATTVVDYIPLLDEARYASRSSERFLTLN